jgi:phosphoglycerate dehydrogenase-like enzyme
MVSKQKIKVAVLDDYQRVARKFGDWSSLEADADITIFHDHVADEAGVVERLRDFSVVCVNRERTPMTRAIVERLPNLKLIATSGHWNASIDMQATSDHGVLVCGSRPDQESCSDLAWGLIIALMRQIPREDKALREGAWQTTVGRGLRGRTLGVLGLGTIGIRVARIGRAFDMDIIAWSQNLTEEKAVAAGTRLVGKEAFFRQSDVVSVHVVLSERTHKLIGAKEFAWMKPTAYLINTARGPIVDEAAMVDALASGRIAGAGLDVFDTEPLPLDSPLRKLDNVILTPHLGGVTDERYRGRYGDVVEDVRAWIAGKPIRIFGPDGRLLKAS